MSKQLLFILNNFSQNLFNNLNRISPSATCILLFIPITLFGYSKNSQNSYWSLITPISIDFGVKGFNFFKSSETKNNYFTFLPEEQNRKLTESQNESNNTDSFTCNTKNVQETKSLSNYNSSQPSILSEDSASLKASGLANSHFATCNVVSGCIGGSAYEDYNCNGINESNEPGQQGVQVVVYNCENTSLDTLLTDNNGDWQICNLTDGEEYRVEFILPDSIASWAMPSHAGIDNGTDIQFLTAPACSSFGLSNIDPCADNVTIISSCYNFGGHDGLYKDNDAFIGVTTNKINDPTLDATSEVIHYATHEEIGTTYGLAVNKSTNTAYVAAYMKRHAGFGPGGTGAIYEIDLTQSTPPTIFADLNSIYGANTTGIDPHDYANTDVCPDGLGGSSNYHCWFNDINSWEKVGMTSLGDMDISDDESSLYVMNLEDRNVYMIDLVNPNGVQTTYPFPLDQATDPNVTLKPLDPEYDVRPFALKYHNNLIYVAAVDSERSRHRDNICCAKGGSVIYVYSLDPTNGTWTLVLEEDVQRGGNNFFMHWNIFYQDFYADNNHMVPSDIEFDGDDIILGLRDLSADKFGNELGKPIAGDQNKIFYASRAGDILRFCYNSTSGQYQFENNGSCGGITTPGANSGYGWPEIGTRGSYYSGDFYSITHPQTSLGGLWIDPLDNRLYSTAFDLINVYQAGVKSFDNSTGLAQESYVIVQNTSGNGGFGKAAGLGDIEAACPIAHPEIGNYIWCDSIENGIQDACEKGINNMIVQLYDINGLLIGQDTSVNGNYYFNQHNVDSTGITVDANGISTPNTEWTGISFSTKYYLIFGNGQFNNITGMFDIGADKYTGITMVNVNSNNNDTVDSDVDDSVLSMAIGSMPANLPVICFTTNSSGCGDHKYDMGVTCNLLYDWGDLPDTGIGTSMLNYETDSMHNGPSHLIIDGLQIGSLLDEEDNGQASTNALGDGSDEDGFNFPNTLNLIPGGTLILPIEITTNTTGLTAYLEAWIDWNGDGDFNDPSEMILDLVDDNTGDFGQNFITVNIPMDAKTDQLIGFRVRLSNTDNMSPYGAVDSGEVEDYLIMVQCKDQICLPIQISRN